MPAVAPASGAGPRADRSGEPIWQALSRCGGFTPLCLQLIRTGKAREALDQMLENTAHHHRQQTYQRADSLAAHLEPMMLVITGSLVGILVVAMYLPVFHRAMPLAGREDEKHWRRAGASAADYRLLNTRFSCS